MGGGIVAFALIMALVSAYIDDVHVKQFNDALDAMLPKKRREKVAFLGHFF